jgi:excisionase family DNA binding protein
MDTVWLSTSDAARELRRSPRTVRRLAASERLAARRFGRAWWVAEPDLAEFIASSPRTADVTGSGERARSPRGGV